MPEMNEPAGNTEKQGANSLFHALLLCLAALIWGSAFVAQSVGSRHVGPFTFLAARNWIALVVLVPVLMIRKHAGSHTERLPASRRRSAAKAAGGIICGTALFLGSSTQQAGIAYTTTAKAGFITTLYVIIVPILAMIVGKMPDRKIWSCVLLGVVGLYLLCMKPGEGGLNRGDMILLACSFLFSIQIMAVDYFIHFVDGVQLAVMQTAVTAVLGTVSMILFEHPAAADLKAALPSILYAGVLSSAIGFTLQIIAQTRLEPTVASLIMCLESVFSALSGWILLGETLNIRELAGCALMFGAIVWSQIPSHEKEMCT